MEALIPEFSQEFATAEELKQQTESLIKEKSQTFDLVETVKTKGFAVIEEYVKQCMTQTENFPVYPSDTPAMYYLKGLIYREVNRMMQGILTLKEMALLNERELERNNRNE